MCQQSKLLLFTLVPALILSTVSYDEAVAQETSDARKSPLEEIIVTANKRSIQSERDYGGSISVLDGSKLDDELANGFGEMFKKTAGVNLNPARAGLDLVSIRGITSTTDASSIAQTTVGVYIDDVPMSSPGADFSVANPYPFDLEAVEILKGPQGALYGSGSMGGAIRYVTAKPDYGKVEGKVGGAYAFLSNGDPSHTLRGMVNIPLADGKAAVRAVAYTQEQGGFINNTGVGVDDANAVTTNGGRITLGFAPNEKLELLASLHHQKVEEDDSPAVFLSTEKQFERSTAILSPLDTEFTLANLNLRYEGSNYTFVSSTSYLEKEIVNPQDISRFITPGLNGLAAFTAFQTGGTPSSINTAFSFLDSKSEALSQEFRLSSNNETGLNWLVGGFYQDTENTTASAGNAPGLENAFNLADGLFGITGTLLFPNDLILDLLSNEDSEEIALFGEVSLNLTDKIELTAGGRYYDNEVRANRFSNSFGAQTTIDSTSSHDGFLTNVVLKMDASENAIVYARAAKGFRNGGENLVANPLTGMAFPSYTPDTVWNYELGTKTEWAGGRVQFDATYFLLRWDDIQLLVLDPASNFGFTANAGEAESKGLEFKFAWAPNDVFSLTTVGSLVDATLENNVTLPTGPVASGTRLPGTPKTQLSNTLSFTWPLRSHQMSAQLVHKYKSDQFNDIATTRTRLSSYTTVDARIGIENERYKVSLYGRNLGNTDARESQILLSAGDPDVYLVRPREIGVQIDLSF